MGGEAEIPDKANPGAIPNLMGPSNQELTVLTRQCLHQRVPDFETLKAHIEA